MSAVVTARLQAENAAHMEQAGRILRSGGLVAVPTETVYGLAANACDGQAVSRIFAVKGRPCDNPLIVHTACAEDAWSLCRSVVPLVEELAAAFWPGPLTLVLPSGGVLPPVVTAGLDTVALRCPAHEAARELIRRARRPLAAPSANLSGRPSPTTAAHVLDDLDGKIEAVVDGGSSRIGVESTVLDCTGATPLILRQGGLSLERLQNVVPTVRVYETRAGEVPRSPGLRHRHYAPRTPLTLLSGDDEASAAYLRKQAEKERLAVLCYDELLPYYQGMRALSYGSRRDPESLAAGLFDALRRLDALNAEHIYAHAPNGGGLCAALRDRLERAAAEGTEGQ